MRSARKLRVQKSLAAQKSTAASFFTATDVIAGSTMRSAVVKPTPWVEPRGITSVPTHAIAVANERRAYSRASLQLPLRFLRIAGLRQTDLDEFWTADISSSGLRTLCPFEISVGTPVHLEVNLVQRADRFGGNVRLVAQAEVVRVNPHCPGWHSVAFSFDEITFQRGELPAPKSIRV